VWSERVIAQDAILAARATDEILLQIPGGFKNICSDFISSAEGSSKPKPLETYQYQL